VVWKSSHQTPPEKKAPSQMTISGIDWSQERGPSDKADCLRQDPTVVVVVVGVLVVVTGEDHAGKAHGR
jgi:hypothetical protein